MRLALASAALLACASGLAGAGQLAPPGTAQRAATALAAASDAYVRGNRKGLARALATLDGLGVHAQEGSPADPMPRWRQKAGTARSIWRGRPLGPGFRSGRLPPGSTESFSQLFLSGEGAAIAVSSPTGNRVAMKVADAKAHTICQGEARRDDTCSWVPLFTQRYTIEVANPGARDAQYFLVVN